MNRQLMAGCAFLLAADSYATSLPEVMDTIQSMDAMELISKIPLHKEDSPLLKDVKRKPRREVYTERHHRDAHEAVHRVNAKRETLGLARIAGGYTDKEEGYEQMQGLIGSLLGVAFGLQYNESGSNACFNAVEGSLVGFDTLMFSLSRMYIPAFWPLIQTGATDFTALSAHLFEDCDVDKFMVMAGGIASAEGMSELGTRASTSYFFEYKTYVDTKDDPKVSSFKKGKAFGELFKKVADYSI